MAQSLAMTFVNEQPPLVNYNTNKIITKTIFFSLQTMLLSKQKF